MQAAKVKLDADYIMSHCDSSWSQVHVLDEVNSTNDWVRQQNNKSIVCLAESQTQGRGRNGSSWLSPEAENIYLSFNWVFNSLPKHLPLLSLWIGIAVAQSIKSLGITNHGIKWPNDLYWQHKKLGGILIETSNASSEVIVGIGLNVNVSEMDDIDQPWTSLNSILNQKIDRNKFLVVLLSNLYAKMVSFQSLQSETLLALWDEWDLIRNKSISFFHAGQQLEGLAQGIDSSGYLLVQMESGKLQAFNTSISKVRW